MSFLVALGIVSSGIWSFLSWFFTSNFFIGLSTICTVFGAIWIYTRQKNEEKQQIAALLVSEIRNAEDSIQSLKKRKKELSIPEISILPQNNWNKYSHLFTKDFNQDEVDSINRFYFDAERANYIANQGNEVELFIFNIRERTRAIHQKIMEIVEKTPQIDLKKKVDEFKLKFDDVSARYQYDPVGYNSMLDIHLNTIVFVLNTPAGQKLKQLAGIK